MKSVTHKFPTNMSLLIDYVSKYYSYSIVVDDIESKIHVIIAPYMIIRWIDNEGHWDEIS